jgi:hypothetical protein
MLKKIFKIISFYDEVRWSSTTNYNLINFYKKTLDDDEKLLTHWLCYISDRHIGFVIFQTDRWRLKEFGKLADLFFQNL